MRQFSTMLRTTFPDLHVTVDEMVAEGDLVATYFTWAGTHLAELQSPAFGRVAPTGKSFTAKGMDPYRILARQIAEIRDSVDRLTCTALGIPTTPQQSAE